MAPKEELVQTKADSMEVMEAEVGLPGNAEPVGPGVHTTHPTPSDGAIDEKQGNDRKDHLVQPQRGMQLNNQSNGQQDHQPEHDQFFQGTLAGSWLDIHHSVPSISQLRFAP